jgi:hypothetical protein
MSVVSRSANKLMHCRDKIDAASLRPTKRGRVALQHVLVKVTVQQHVRHVEQAKGVHADHVITANEREEVETQLQPEAEVTLIV